jgi:Tfp pilus assembly protein PilO
LYSYPLKGTDENNIWPMSVLLLIIVAIVFLAIIGLGWNTFFDGVLKGADKIGIASILENATQSATEMAKNASRNLVG